MDKIKSKQYFIDNFNGGSLYIEKELLRYNGTPLICICKDTEDNLYLTHCYEDWKNFSCLITKIEDVDLYNLVTKGKPYLIFERSEELYNLHNETLTKLNVEEFKKLDVIYKDFEYTDDIRKAIKNYINNNLYVTSDENKKKDLSIL